MMTVSSKHAKCNQVPSIKSGSYSSSFYSTINFGSNHSGPSLHLNITNDVTSASLNKDRVSSFTCLFDGLISSDFRIVVILILLDSDVHNLCSVLPHMLILTIFVYL